MRQLFHLIASVADLDPRWTGWFVRSVTVPATAVGLVSPEARKWLVHELVTHVGEPVAARAKWMMAIVQEAVQRRLEEMNR